MSPQASQEELEGPPTRLKLRPWSSDTKMPPAPFSGLAYQLRKHGASGSSSSSSVSSGYNHAIAMEVCREWVQYTGQQLIDWSSRAAALAPCWASSPVGVVVPLCSSDKHSAGCCWVEGKAVGAVGHCLVLRVDHAPGVTAIL